MSVYDSRTEWAGRPVVDWSEENKIADPVGTAYRLRVSYDEGKAGHSWSDRFAAFLDDPRAGEVTAFIVGNWDAQFMQAAADTAIETLASAAERLPKLTALFFGDISSEESEISWIQQGDLSPLFNAFPDLEHFGVRGGEGLSLGIPRLLRLKTLVVESGGLPLSVVEEVAAADLPSLEHLELWLGTEDYGAEATIEDLTPFLGEQAPAKWSNLRSLGLRDSELADEIATAITQSPILKQLEVLDLSLGTFGNEGVEALVAAAPSLTGLKKLDIHHHYASPEKLAELTAALPAVEIDAAEPQTIRTRGGAEWRYVAIGE